MHKPISLREAIRIFSDLEKWQELSDICLRDSEDIFEVLGQYSNWVLAADEINLPREINIDFVNSIISGDLVCLGFSPLCEDRVKIPENLFRPALTAVYSYGIMRKSIFQLNYQDETGHGLGFSFVGIQVYSLKNHLKYFTGAPGRPNGTYLIKQEARRRIHAGEASIKRNDEAEYLLEWHLKTHPDMAPVKIKTVTNMLSEIRKEERKYSP